MSVLVDACSSVTSHCVPSAFEAFIVILAGAPVVLNPPPTIFLPLEHAAVAVRDPPLPVADAVTFSHPLTPCIPAVPCSPRSPTAPVPPCGPMGPWRPTAPVPPLGPMIPWRPSDPVPPRGPCSPWGPAGPGVACTASMRSRRSHRNAKKLTCRVLVQCSSKNLSASDV